MKPSYYIAALWDAEASVWYSESNIPGLVIEVETLTDFEQLANELGPDLLAENENIDNIRMAVATTRLSAPLSICWPCWFFTGAVDPTP